MWTILRCAVVNSAGGRGNIPVARYGLDSHSRRARQPPKAEFGPHAVVRVDETYGMNAVVPRQAGPQQRADRPARSNVPTYQPAPGLHPVLGYRLTVEA
jgi:hypothetical protein